MIKYIKIDLPDNVKKKYEPYKVLILEDDKGRIPGLSSIFNEVGAEITWTDTAKECISIIKESDSFDIIFLDHDLGGLSYVDHNREDTGSNTRL